MEYILEIGRVEEVALAEMKAVLGEESLKYISGRYLYVSTDRVLDQKFLDKVGSVVGVFEILKVAKEELGKKAVVDCFLEQGLERIFEKGHIFFESNYMHRNDRRRCLMESKKIMLKNKIKVKFRENWSTAGIWGDGWPNELIALKALKFRSEYFLLNLLAVQDINAYTERDAGKPYRDAVLGMLPPKLSQSMVNIGLGQNFWNAEEVKVMDPFCGTGTVLMEAQLIGCKVKGSDIEKVNVEGTSKNFESVLDSKVEVFKRDARDLSYEDISDVQLFVTEGYLGKPKRGGELMADLEDESKSIERLMVGFLDNLVEVKNEQKFEVVFCVPVYVSGKQKVFMKKLVEKCKELGYIVSTLIPEMNVPGSKDKSSLLYGRSDQFVYRQIFKLEYNPG